MYFTLEYVSNSESMATTRTATAAAAATAKGVAYALQDVRVRVDRARC